MTHTNGRRAFWLERFDFANAGLAPGLQIACVAHAGSTEEYFKLGSVENPVHTTLDINELAPDRPLRFRFLVYEDGDPRLIAFADNIRPLDEGGFLGESLIDIQPCPLGGPSWRLDIPSVSQNAGAEKPVLLVESDLFPTAQAAAKDVWIAVLVMPEVMRKIATVIADCPGCLDDSELWTSQWSDFIVGLGLEGLPEDADEIAKEQWVQEVVSVFCARPSMRAQFGFAITELTGER